MKIAQMNFLQSVCSATFRPAIATVLLGLICSPCVVYAALVTHTAIATWQSAVTGPTMIDFDSLPDCTAVSNQFPGVTFSSFNGGKPLAAAESSPFSPPNVLSVDNPTGSSGGGVTIDFASPKKGVAFQYNDSQFKGNSVTVFDSSNQILGTFELKHPHPTEWLFVGFTSSNNDISKVVIKMGDTDRVTLDSFQVSAGPAVKPSLICVEASSSGSRSCKDAGNFDSTCATAKCPAEFTITGGGGICAAGDSKIKGLIPKLATGEFTIMCEKQGVNPQARAICCKL